MQPDQVRRDARMGHEILLAVTSTVGLLIVLVSPLAVDLGVTGALVVVCACVVLMLRTRQYRVGSEVATGLAVRDGRAGGARGQHHRRAADLARGPRAAAGGHRRGPARLHARPDGSVGPTGRLGDIGELVALVAMLPLLVFAIGLVGAVGG